MNLVFGGGDAEFLLLSGVLVQKQASQKGDGSYPLFNFWFWWLLVDVTTRL